MDETEIKKWLGLPPRERVATHIVEGLADVPAPIPGDTDSHIAAYRAFLRVADSPSTPARLSRAAERARCRHGDHEIFRLPSGVWVDEMGFVGCVKGGLWRDPLTEEVCDRPAVTHEPMPEAVPVKHRHTYSGQGITHTHERGGEPHGYYGHPEDGGYTPPRGPGDVWEVLPEVPQ